MTATRGYALPRPSPNAEDPWVGFEWQLDGPYNVATVALAAADDSRDRTALRHVPLDGPPTGITYRELDAASDAVAADLRDRGVSRGDRVAVCLPQCPELAVAHLATFKLGAVVVPLSMLLGAESFAYSLANSGTSLLVIDRERADAVDSPDAVTTVRVEPGGYDDSPLGGFDPSVTAGGSVSTVETSPDDTALILYTSGTTGKPKGVVQGHQYLAGSLPGYQAWFQLFDDEGSTAHVWTPGEWAWAGALFDVVFSTLAMGATVVSRERRSGFDPATALSLIENEGVTHTFMPATALQRIRREATVDEYDVTSLEVVMSGGENLPGSLLSWARETLAPSIHETYGQTEANALVGNCSAAYVVRPGSMGKAYPGHDVVVVDEAGDAVPDGDIGEIAVRLPDPVVFEGYWRDEGATAEKFDGDLFRTGDLAVRDTDGYFWHRGRKDDLIVTAGYRVSPLEVEEVLQSQPAVGSAVVGSIPDEERGERVTAYVVPAEGESADENTIATLQDAVRSELGAYKVPREIVFIDEIPETRSGKTDRSVLFEAER